ncbi:MAG TPA: TerC family protein [Dehalococcoidia bacterium]|nr:TerC family protein [Dehalococcoidia bacterium]
MEIETIALWGGFLLGLAALLFFDLFVIHRKSHVVGVREALGWTGIWIALALLFGGGVFIFGGTDKGTEYLTGYVIEKSLSVDNVFIFLIIFQYFAVPPHLQPKVLHWGIFGALAMRLAFILIGAALLDAFHWMIYVFGGILLVTAARLAFQDEHEVHPDKNPLIRLLKRFFPITQDYNDGKFFTRRAGVLMATPLFAVLLMVESTDLVFAIDSIPAIFAVTRDPFIVFTSNAFAILGLRALYFALAGVMVYFTYLRQGLVVILAFVGAKMVLSDVYHVPTLASLAVVVGVLAIAVGASIVFRKKADAGDGTPGHEIAHKPLLQPDSDSP